MVDTRSIAVRSSGNVSRSSSQKDLSVVAKDISHLIASGEITPQKPPRPTEEAMTGARTLRRGRRQRRTRRRQRGGAVTSLADWTAAVQAHMTANPLGSNPFKSLVDPSLTLPENGEGFNVDGLGDIRQVGYTLLGSPVFTEIADLTETEYGTRVSNMDEDLRGDFEIIVESLNKALQPTNRLESPTLVANERPIYAWYFLVNLPSVSEDKMRPIGFTKLPTQEERSVPLNR